MQRWLVVFVVVAACKSGKDAGKPTEVVRNTAEAVPAPKVSVGTVLAKDDGQPPLLLILDAGGTARIAAAKTWADLDANKLVVGKAAGKLEVLDKITREGYVLKRAPIATVEDWNKLGDSPRDLTALDTAPAPTANQDDPPPPPAQDDEGGGTGTAMALDEGKMGKKDAEEARVNGVLGSQSLLSPPGTGWADRPNEDGSPSRVAAFEGRVARDGKLDPLRAMILVAPTAKATVLIDAVRNTNDAIAVSFNGKIRPLRLQFSMRDTAMAPEARYWIEARVSAKGIAVEAVPDKPIEVAAIDQLADAIQKARTAKNAGEPGSFDILVDPDVDVQRLVDVIVALDAAGANVIGLGPAATAEQLARRGHRIPLAHLGVPNVQGDIDKADVRKVVKAAQPQIAACYDKALAVSPSLHGTVMVQFAIKPNGSVGAVQGTGVDPELANCVANVVKPLAFPKTKGAGIQVIYPFSFANL